MPAKIYEQILFSLRFEYTSWVAFFLGVLAILLLALLIQAIKEKEIVGPLAGAAVLLIFLALPGQFVLERVCEAWLTPDLAVLRKCKESGVQFERVVEDENVRWCAKPQRNGLFN